MWWEIRRLAVVVLVVDALVVAVCLGICFAIGAASPEGVSTAVFIAGVVLAFCATGIGAGPVRMGMPLDQRMEHGSVLFETQLNEMEATTRSRNIQYEIDQFRNVSWTMALGFAAMTLVAVSALVLFV